MAAAIDDGGWSGAWVAEAGDSLPAICIASVSSRIRDGAGHRA